MNVQVSFVEEAASYCRHSFIVKELGIKSLKETQLNFTEDALKSFEQLASKSSLLELNRVFRVLTGVLKDFSGSELDRYIFENTCIPSSVMVTGITSLSG